MRRALRPLAALALLVMIAVLASCAGAAETRTAAPAETRTAAAAESRTPSADAPSASPAPPACPRSTPVAPRQDGLPALTLPCLGPGPDVRLSDLRGTPTIVNVWAAWCTNCDREMPLFTRLQERAGDRLRMFGVHYKAPRGFALRSAADFGVSFPSVHDEDGDAVTAQLEVPGPPTTLFVTAEGVVAGRKIGEIRSYDELSRLVEAHLGVAL